MTGKAIWDGAVPGLGTKEKTRSSKGVRSMSGHTQQVELLAQRIWSEWLTLGDTMRIAERFGYPKNEYGWATQLDGLKWGDLPENVKDHVRDMAEEEIILVQTTPQTEV